MSLLDVCTLEFLINVLHVYLYLRGFSFQHDLIRNNTFINLHIYFNQKAPIFNKRMKILVWKQLFVGLFHASTNNSIIFTELFPQAIQFYKFSFKSELISFPKFPTNTIIRTNTFINFQGKLLPTRLFHPTRLLGTLE